MWSRGARVESFQESGLTVSRGGDEVLVAYSDILTAERLRSRRGLRFHMREGKPILVRVKRRELFDIEDRLRAWGVRVVDCWGAILTATLFDFEQELDRDPVRVRQSSDDA